MLSIDIKLTIIGLFSIIKFKILLYIIVSSFPFISLVKYVGSILINVLTIKSTTSCFPFELILLISSSVRYNSGSIVFIFIFKFFPSINSTLNFEHNFKILKKLLELISIIYSLDILLIIDLIKEFCNFSSKSPFFPQK